MSEEGSDLRPADERYFAEIEAELETAFAVANAARERGDDPAPEVEIPVAQDMADRVENILGIDGVAARVRELEGERSREEAALALVEDFVAGTVGDYDTRAGKIEGAVRTAVALLTEGVVAAPIEGIDRVEILENDDGTEFVNVYYAGPIRSAGGTAQALSVLVADYARALLGIDQFKPREDEVGRYAQEVALYDEEVGMQYAPGETEARFIAEHMPIMLDGESTGDGEIEGFRNLERVDTDDTRGGMCLVFGEGLALKAPKIQRYTRDLAEVEWPWLQDLIDGTYDEDAPAEGDGAETTDDGEGSERTGDADSAGGGEDGSGGAGPPRADPSKKFLADLIAGRPVFAHPSEAGGFRLRYGRARNHGHATAGIHPATMHLVDDFLAAGTQVKTERPGKAAGIVPVDTIEGPTVRLASGEVRRIDDAAEALELRNGVERVLDLGEYLVNYGEFVENNYPLAPASYTVEWWRQEFAAAGGPVQALRDDPSVDLTAPSPREAIGWATARDAPLHPAYTYLWHDVGVDAVERLADAVAEGEIVTTDGATGRRAVEDSLSEDRLELPHTDEVRETLETLLVEHHQREERLVVPDWRPLALTLGFDDRLERVTAFDAVSEASRRYDDGENAIRAVNDLAPFDVRERAPTRVGARMGRPEKSEQRELSPAVHTLFPIGEAGGDQRSLEDAASHGDAVEGTQGEVELEVGRRECVECGTVSYHPRCPDCGGIARAVYRCPDCDREVDPDESGRAECQNCEVLARPTQYTTVDIGDELADAKATVGERATAYDVLKGVKGLTSKEKVPEPLEKGILRAKHDVSAFKDGTVRYDMTDLPVTAVRPSELDVTAGDLQELGYREDIHGEPLGHDDQLVSLKVQDIVLSDGAAEHMLKTADFVDDLLAQYYGLDPYYEFEERSDLVGELVFGMAPHTSAAVVGRVVGFTSAAVGYAHPYFHAAKRRNCFHPETKVWYENERGDLRYEPIEDVVETRLEDPEADDLGTLVQKLDNKIYAPSLDDDGELVRKPITAVSKHPAPDHTVTVETRSGRQLTVTPDHEIEVYDDGTLRSKRASALTTDDRLVTPTHLDVAMGDNPAQFDLLAQFIQSDTIDTDRLMIAGLNKERLYELFEEQLAGEWDGQFYPLKSTAEYLEMSHKTLSNYLYRGRFPAGLLCRLLDSTEDVLAFVPDDVRLGMKRDSPAIDRMLTINERVGTLLGYYAAEGFTRTQETSKGTIHQTTICGTESEARDFFIDVLETEFGTEPYRENSAKVTVSGRLVRTVFDTVFDAGVDAHTKRVPQCLFGAPERIVAAYLGGYFSGDGSVSAGGFEVSAQTVSRELVEDTLALLTRLGITGRVETSEPVPLSEKFPGFYDSDGKEMTSEIHTLSVYSEDALRFAEIVPLHLSRKDELLQSQAANAKVAGRYAFDDGTGDYLVETVADIEYDRSTSEATYCLTVKNTHKLIANDVSSKQCDGDEDCVMLLLDGLLNFSEKFLPNQRGGCMDAPLVMSSRIDPTEIDDEAHNVDTMASYPVEFYEATREMADPADIAENMTIAEETLGTDRQYAGFAHTHDTTDIAAGPDLSAYKTLGSMEEKMDAQLALSRKLRAVEESDVAERIIEHHFLPDLLGNLKAFSSQEFRCLGCGEKYRRAPLSGECRRCGGDVNLTVHEGSVNKYIDTAIRVAEQFGARDYTKQRLEILETRIDRVFEDDTNKASTLGDYM
jgi:DNA polymerase II large subunit